MMYILENENLRVKISSLGAELQSIRRPATDTEYLWQGDPAYWGRRASNLFPVCGRLAGGGYTYGGQRYEMGSHGFARNKEWTVLRQKADTLTLQLLPDEDTLAAYPFRFGMEMTYTLTGDSLSVTTVVRNEDHKTMPFAIGGHPGFNVPLTEGERFEDYYIEFDQPCQPLAFALAENCFFTGEMKPLPLEDAQRLPLRHSLFDGDAIFLRDAAPGVALRSTTGDRGVHLSYPDAPYVGLWHNPKTDAPFVCLEPWVSLPARDSIVEDFAQKGDLIRLEAGELYDHTWTITIF